VAERVETLALLFTDIEGSTNLLRSLGAEYRRLLAEHRRVLRDAFAAHGGTVLQREGDALFVTFRRSLVGDTRSDRWTSSAGKNQVARRLTRARSDGYPRRRGDHR